MWLNELEEDRPLRLAAMKMPQLAGWLHTLIILSWDVGRAMEMSHMITSLDVPSLVDLCNTKNGDSTSGSHVPRNYTNTSVDSDGFRSSRPPASAGGRCRENGVVTAYPPKLINAQVEFESLELFWEYY